MSVNWFSMNTLCTSFNFLLSKITRCLEEFLLLSKSRWCLTPCYVWLLIPKKSPRETLLGHVSRGYEDSKNILFEIIYHRLREIFRSEHISILCNLLGTFQLCGAAIHWSVYSLKWLFAEAVFHWTNTKVHLSSNCQTFKFGELPLIILPAAITNICFYLENSYFLTFFIMKIIFHYASQKNLVTLLEENKQKNINKHTVSRFTMLDTPVPIW